MPRIHRHRKAPGWRVVQPDAGGYRGVRESEEGRVEQLNRSTGNPMGEYVAHVCNRVRKGTESINSFQCGIRR